MAMTAENVIIPAAFESRIEKSKLEELKASGALGSNPLPFDKLELEEVKYGDHVLGILTDDECELFCLYYATSKELEDADREIGAGVLEQAAQAVRDKKEQELMREGLTIREEDAPRFFKLRRRMEYLRSLLYFTLCEKYNCHEFKVGVRAGRKFVKGERL